MINTLKNSEILPFKLAGKATRSLIAPAALLLAVPLMHAEIKTWDAAVADYGTAGNWSPAGVPVSGDEVRLDNGGTATISSGTYESGNFYLGRLANNVGNLSMTGGSLSTGVVYVASAGGTTGDITMTGSSVLNSGNFQIGSRGTATMSVGTDASVGSAILYVGVISGSDGTLNLSGDWTASRVIYSNNSASTGRINLNGGSLTVSGDFDADNASVSSRLSVNGSDGTFSADNFLAASNTMTLDFNADASGFTTLSVTDSINITNATLNIDLSAYSGALGMTLMDGASLTGTFGSVNFLGGTGSESIVYDTINGDLVLVPEPSTTVSMLGLTGILLMGLRLRRRRQ